jgi:hypothetical protein
VRPRRTQGVEDTNDLIRASALALLVVATGCGTHLQIRTLQPAQSNFGAARRLSIAQTEGRRSAREAVIAEVQKQARRAGYYQLADRTEEGITMKVAGRSVEVTGAKQPQAADEVFVRIDILEWQASKDTRMVTEDGVEKEIKFIKGKVLLGVTAATAKGRAILAEKEFQAESEGRSDDDAINAAAASRLAAQESLSSL